MLTLRRSSIRPVPPYEKVCYVCNEMDAAAARDLATGGYICSECIPYALNAEMMIMAAWKHMKVPRPNGYVPPTAKDLADKPAPRGRGRGRGR